MEVSNRTILYLIVVALVVSAGGTMINLSKLNSLRSRMGVTGMVVNDSFGQINLTVSDITEINLTNSTVNFGSGRVISGQTNCTMNTSGHDSYGCGGQWPTTDPGALVLRNIGNNGVNISVWIEKNRTDFFGTNSTLSNFSIKVESPAGETPCGSNYEHGYWTEIEHNWSRLEGEAICDSSNKLGYLPDRDELYFQIMVTVPHNATSGSKGVIVNVTADDS